VHPTDIRALRLLDAAVERPMTIGELGAGLGLSSGAVSELVDRLEASGLAKRIRDESDRRRVLVQLGPAARTFGREQLAPIATAIQRAITDADDDALNAVQRFLSVLLAEQGDGQANSGVVSE
jgi:DNA-binding MarR family transcriptional regulator